MSYFPTPSRAQAAGCLAAAIILVLLVLVGLGTVLWGLWWVWTHIDLTVTP